MASLVRQSGCEKSRNCRTFWKVRSTFIDSILWGSNSDLIVYIDSRPDTPEGTTGPEESATGTESHCTTLCTKRLDRLRSPESVQIGGVVGPSFSLLSRQFRCLVLFLPEVLQGGIPRGISQWTVNNFLHSVHRLRSGPCGYRVARRPPIRQPRRHSTIDRLTSGPCAYELLDAEL